MTYESVSIVSDQSTLPRLPAWVTSPRAETPETVAFSSGASFALLDLILCQSGDSIPKELLANTLALKAAVATSKLEGRMAREQDIRDAYHLTPAGDDGIRHLGPDGDVLAFWRKTVRIRLTGRDGAGSVAQRAAPHLSDRVRDWLEAAMDRSRSEGPLPAAVYIMLKVLEADDRGERFACLMSDVVLAQFFGWERPLPLTALHLTKANLRHLRDGAGGAEIAIQNAITQGAQTAFRVATTLAERADALRAVAPKLRAKGSNDAIAIFLSEDAVAPSGMLSPTIRGTKTPMTARAARRLCDRLVELGVVRELTGRPTFRLYGIAP